MGEFGEEHLRRRLPGFAVDTDIGDGVEPDFSGRIDRGEVREVRSGEEVLLHVADAVFHPSLLVSLGNAAGRDREAGMQGEVQVTRVEHRCLPPRVLEDRTFQIINHNSGGNPAERDKGVLMAGEEG